MADVSNTQFYDLEPEEPKKKGLSTKSLVIIVSSLVGVIMVALVVVFIVNSSREGRVQEEDMLAQVEREMEQDMNGCLEDEDPELCQIRVRSEKARETGQVEVCDGLEGEELTNCVELIAFDQLDITACEALEVGVSDCQDSVYGRLAYEATDYALCDMIVNEERRTSCQEGLVDELVELGECEAVGVDPEVCSAEKLLQDALATGDVATCETMLPADLDFMCEEVIPTQIQEPYDPNQVDEDEDGLTLGLETQYGTLDDTPDSDGDGLSDGDEVFIYLTDPTNGDTDGDGYDDGTEVLSGNDPLS